MEGLFEKTLGQMLREVAEKYPANQAVKYIETDYDRTYAEFDGDVDKIARGLLGMGFKKGDHIAVWATNYPQWLVLMFATARIGAVLVAANTSYKQHEIKYLLEHSDSKAVFICGGLKDIDSVKILHNLCPELKTCEKGKLKAKQLPKLRCVVSMNNCYNGMYNWKEIESFGARVKDSEYTAAQQALSPHDVINIQYTSGTTGFPKGVMLTHHSILNNAYAVGEGMKLTHKDRLCMPVSFFYCGGIGMVLTCISHGTAIIPLFFYTPLKVLHAIEYEKCTAVNGVPTMFAGILEHPDFLNYDCSTLRKGGIGGSLCPIHVMKNMISKMNLREIVGGFGLTETSPICTAVAIDDTLKQKTETVGKALPFVEIKIVNPKTGAEVPDGEEGEFVTRGYHLMKGYYKMPQATAAAIDKDGWLHTGDLAARDKQGYYKITGRIKDMICRGGENLYAKEIENFIFTHPAVRDVQVVGVPSEYYGEEAFAYIIKKPNAQVTPEEIKLYVAQNLSERKTPAYVHFVSNFPTTASGKVQKFKLREMAQEILKDGEKA